MIFKNWLCEKVIPSKELLGTLHRHLDQRSYIQGSDTVRASDRQQFCRARCLGGWETTATIIQHCCRFHGSRILMHDAIFSIMANSFSRPGWHVERERSFSTSIGVLKPDILAIGDGAGLLIDTRIVFGGQEFGPSTLKKFKNITWGRPMKQHWNITGTSFLWLWFGLGTPRLCPRWT